MRNFGNHAIMALMWVVMAAMIWMLYGVMAQPMVYGSEKPILDQGYLDSGILGDPVERPQIVSKRFSRSEGYLYTPETGITRHVEIRSYTVGDLTIHTGRVGQANIYLEPRVRELLEAQETKPLEQ